MREFAISGDIFDEADAAWKDAQEHRDGSTAVIVHPSGRRYVVIRKEHADAITATAIYRKKRIEELEKCVQS